MPFMDKVKSRVIVLTDISSVTGGFKEPDDGQSLVRFLMYANEFDIEGLIATHTNHWNDRKPEYIREILEHYGQVHGNLSLHDPAFPRKEELLRVVKAGNPHDGREFVGEGHDTEASEWIIAAAEKDDQRPLWILVWGGTTDLAQALWRAGNRNNPEQLARIVSKLRIYSISDQYGIGAWIREQHPDLFYITSYRNYRGMYKGGDVSLVTAEWLEGNITKQHGPLGEAYPIYQGGDIYGSKVHGIKEGDTPTFLYLIPNGLGDSEHPEYGGWGGRFQTVPNGSPCHYFDAVENLVEEHSDSALWASVYRWRPAYQRSFQARMDWCVKSPEEANHEPVVSVSGPLRRTVSPGERVMISAAGSIDPDGNGLSYSWDVYQEAGSYRGTLVLEIGCEQQVMFTAPQVDTPQTIHIVLSVTNNGLPPMTSYGRIVVTVDPFTEEAVSLE